MNAGAHRPTVWLFTLSLNEAQVLPFFFRHYDPWVDRYVIFDDGSTDGTIAQLAAHPRVEIRRFTRTIPGSFVESHRIWQNAAWKEARGQADFVVLTAIDEHLYHPDMTDYLRRCQAVGVTALPALGFNMLADGFPGPGTHLAEALRLGAPDSLMNKLSLFDPNAIAETNFGPGRHVATPSGRVCIPATDEVLNLHYKYLGQSYVAARHAALRAGLGALDRQVGHGAHYDWDGDRLDEEWRRLQAQAIDYRDPSVGIATHPDRWWRAKILSLFIAPGLFIARAVRRRIPATAKDIHRSDRLSFHDCQPGAARRQSAARHQGADAVSRLPACHAIIIIDRLSTTAVSR